MGRRGVRFIYSKPRSGRPRKINEKEGKVIR
jgi:hypothetical protein